MEFSTPRDLPGRPCPPTDHPRSRPPLTSSASSSEVGPGLLERLAQVPDPRDPRGVRHALAVVLALRWQPFRLGAVARTLPFSPYGSARGRRLHADHYRSRRGHAPAGDKSVTLAETPWFGAAYSPGDARTYHR